MSVICFGQSLDEMWVDPTKPFSSSAAKYVSSVYGIDRTGNRVFRAQMVRNGEKMKSSTNAMMPSPIAVFICDLQASVDIPT